VEAGEGRGLAGDLHHHHHEPNELIRPIHDRMPVILAGDGRPLAGPNEKRPGEAEGAPSTGAGGPAGRALGLPKANNVKNDVPEVLEAVTVGF
jgi:hypothetical protein